MACQMETGQAFLQPSHRLTVMTEAEIVLRDRLPPEGHMTESRLASYAKQAFQVSADRPDEFLFGEEGQLGMPLPSDVGRESEMARRGTVREERRREGVPILRSMLSG